MLARGGERRAIKPQHAPRRRCSADCRNPLEIMPLLLMGDPGIVKTLAPKDFDVERLRRQSRIGFMY